MTDPEGAVPAAPNGNGHKTLVMKLAEVLAAVERVPKRGRNDFHHYDYATEADIAAAIRKELAARHLMLIPAIVGEQRHPVGDKGSVLTVLEMEMEFLDGETGESIKKPWRGYGTDKEDKGGYKAITGGEKYFLLKSFLIPTGDDPERDGEAPASSQRAPRADRQSAPPAAPQGRIIGDPDAKAEPKADTAAEAALIFDAELPDDATARAGFEAGSRDCPACHAKGTIIRGKKEYGGGWVCWHRDKTKACGSKWPDKKAAAPAAPDPFQIDDDRPYMVGAIIRKQNEYKCSQAERQALIRDVLHGQPAEAATLEAVRKAYALLNDYEAFQQWRLEFQRQ